MGWLEEMRRSSELEGAFCFLNYPYNGQLLPKERPVCVCEKNLLHLPGEIRIFSTKIISMLMVDYRGRYELNVSAPAGEQPAK
jgi:hypothetical protein